jgi:hypothetical protein
MFTEVYLTTTNPKSTSADYKKIMGKIAITIIVHTLIYAGFCNLVSYIFLGKVLNKEINVRLFSCLIAIMISGFVARYYHVKDVYNAYNGDIVKTRNHLDKLYISWIFIS